MDHDAERHQQHRQQHHHHHHHSHERFEPPPICPVEHLSAAVQSLDTVRALHSTVVSLRTALEEAHREIDQLKKQIRIGEDIESGKEFRRSLDNLSDRPATVTAEVRSSSAARKSGPTGCSTAPSGRKSRRLSGSSSSSSRKPPPPPPTQKQHQSQKHGSYSIRVHPEDIRITSGSCGPEHRKPMASKIDVQIKVSSNFKRVGDGDSDANNLTEMMSGESDSHVDTEPSDVDAPPPPSPPPPSHVPPNNPLHRSSSSSSDGENSVFDDAVSPAPAKLAQHDQQHSEEVVDDIELIFSADDKDFAQQQDDEDLVSITGDYEPWSKSGKSGTPVLVNYGSIGSDTETATAAATAAMAADGDGDGGATMARDDSYDSFYPLTNSSSYLAGSGGGALRWTNQNVLIETDISKCGIVDADADGDPPATTTGRLDLSRRNTCPNPPAYRPLIHRDAMAALDRQHQGTGGIVGGRTSHTGRTPLAVKFSRNSRAGHFAVLPTIGGGPPSDDVVQRTAEQRSGLDTAAAGGSGPKRHSAAQTEISALPEHWRSESHLVADGAPVCGDGGFYTLPSKFVPLTPTSLGCHRYQVKVNGQTQEARRVLLSDINFTSMVPELSRSADHLCQAENADPNSAAAAAAAAADGDASTATPANSAYYKGVTHLQTPDYKGPSATSGTPTKGMTPSASLQTSPGVSQWTVSHSNSNYSNAGGSSSNTNNAAQQTTQTHDTGNSAGTGAGAGGYGRHDSTDSCRSGYSLSSRHSTAAGGAGQLHKSARSRSVPSVARCTALCRPGYHHQLHHAHQLHHHHHAALHSHAAHHHHHHYGGGAGRYGGGGGSGSSGPQPMGLRGSESMHYTPRVTFQEPGAASGSCRAGGSAAAAALAGTGGGQARAGIVRGSLPDLRTECACAVARRESMLRGCAAYGGSSGSTDSLLDEADDLMRSSGSGGVLGVTGGGGGTECKRSVSGGGWSVGTSTVAAAATSGSRRFSENDIKRDYTPSKQSLPFLPKSPKCLKLGHLVKVITRTGRVVVGRVRYIGPLAGAEYTETETYVGLQLPSKVGDSDGSIEGRRFFECAPQHGIFVPFKKIIMAWTA